MCGPSRLTTLPSTAMAAPTHEEPTEKLHGQLPISGHIPLERNGLARNRYYVRKEFCDCGSYRNCVVIDNPTRSRVRSDLVAYRFGEPLSKRVSVLQINNPDCGYCLF